MTPKTPDSDFEAEALLEALKELLRERKIGYQTIADSMQVSLATVKRMLNRPNLPIDRLFSICRIAQIDPMDVFTIAARKRPRHTTLTAEQDALFFETPAFLSYFLCLIEDGRTPDEIADAENLTSLSTERYLSGLQKVGLIARDTGTKIRLLIEPPIGFGPDSQVLRTQHTEFLQHTVGQVLSPDRSASDKKIFAILKPLRLQHPLFLEMIGEIRAVIDKYAYLSEHPGNRDVPDREDWNLALAAGPGFPENRAPITNL